MEEIRIDRIQNGYTIYQHGVGTIFFSKKEELVDKIKELMSNH